MSLAAKKMRSIVIFKIKGFQLMAKKSSKRTKLCMPKDPYVYFSWKQNRTKTGQEDITVNLCSGR